MKDLVPDEYIPEILDRLEQMHPEAACALDFGTHFQLLSAVMLSAQTTDVSVNKVTPVLFAKYPTAEAMAEADPLEVQEIIKTIGLYKNKSKNIVALSKMLVEEYGGEVPGSFDELVKLPGVGRKTANVVLAEGFGEARIVADQYPDFSDLRIPDRQEVAGLKSGALAADQMRLRVAADDVAGVIYQERAVPDAVSR